MNTINMSVQLMVQNRDLQWLCNLESQFAERIARGENLKENINIQLTISESRRFVAELLVNERPCQWTCWWDCGLMCINL